MRGFGVASCAAALVLSAGAARAASPLSGSDTMMIYGDWADGAIGGRGQEGFLLTVKVDLSRLADPTGFILADYGVFYDTEGAWVQQVNVRNAQFNFDPYQPWHTDPASQDGLFVNPTADGFTVLFRPPFDCLEPRGRTRCLTVWYVNQIQFGGKVIGDDPINYSWTFSELPPTNAIPEPATWAMMIMGFGLVGAGLRRRTTLAA